jgi:DNA polymerase (family X)
MEAAKLTGTILEINSQPLRMDLNEELARIAREKGVMLYISSDAHDAVDFHYMKLGVAIARRAWCAKKDVLNTRSWKELDDMIAKKKSRTARRIVVR